MLHLAAIILRLDNRYDVALGNVGMLCMWAPGRGVDGARSSADPALTLTLIA